jgi:hypothetical protein
LCFPGANPAESPAASDWRSVDFPAATLRKTEIFRVVAGFLAGTMLNSANCTQPQGMIRKAHLPTALLAALTFLQTTAAVQRDPLLSGDSDKAAAGPAADGSKRADAPGEKRLFLGLTLPFHCQLTDINDQGDIIASYGRNAGFIFQKDDGTVAVLIGPKPGMPEVVPVALNNKGQVLVAPAGTPARGASHLYDLHDKTYTPIGQIGQVSGVGSGNIIITGFNDASQLIGMLQVPNDANDASALYEIGVYGTPAMGFPGAADAPTSPGSFVALRAPNGGRIRPVAINNRGQIVGVCTESARSKRLVGFLYDSASDTWKIFSYPGSKMTEPAAINDNGLIAGSCELKTGRCGFVYDGTQFTRLYPGGGEPAKGAEAYLPLGLNNRGDLVGESGKLASFISTPAGSALPPVADAMGAYDLSAPRPAGKMPALHRSEKPPVRIKDPNLPLAEESCGSSRAGVLRYTYGLGDRSIVPVLKLIHFQEIDDCSYLGFDDAHGSLFLDVADGHVYAFSRKTNTVSWFAKGLWYLPENVVVNLKNPSPAMKDYLGEFPTAKPTTAKPAHAKPAPTTTAPAANGPTSALSSGAGAGKPHDDTETKR